jgi:hypothetical protein
MSDKKTEARMSRLMDFGRFAGNARLARLAAQAEARYPAPEGRRELADEELDDLFAAGDTAFPGFPEEDDDDH